MPIKQKSPKRNETKKENLMKWNISIVRGKESIEILKVVASEIEKKSKDGKPLKRW